jgi:Universal stress protein family
MASKERIVVGGDTTPSATAALRWAVEEAARQRHTSVLVVHAFDVEGRADLALERDLDRCRRDARYRTQSWVVEVLSTIDIEVPVLVQTPDASVEDALATAAANASMVVIGEPQNDRRRDLAARLSQRVVCPVVTVGVGHASALAG